ncbi:cation:proton antiporter [Saccharothrix australiensis]|uniref:Kef-type K+ transport system membrane component KefB n=1 Tax=Saccharothrix australiensis TaxID=2072 RepID=A0A495VYC4_9PSEU|nr:cation:proton antiporter [Saccharothrix australiensis]RKT54249.1 Kef-type K+ transport system membrane component KefB [Saccharothrix australiensis]
MTEHQAVLLLVDLALIVALAGAAGAVARRLGQPAVLGEIAVGVLLGPTLFDGAVPDALFPPDVRPLLSAVGNLGVLLFMFVVGYEFDRSRLRGSGRPATAAALGSAVVPFALGVLLALWLVGRHQTVHRVGFALFLGLALAVTAFPVLARIIADRGMGSSRIGAIALSAAAVCDVAAWSALALVQAVVGRDGVPHWQVLLAVPYVVLMFVVVRPLLAKALVPSAPLTPGRFGVVLVGLLASAAATQLIGLHFLFGAFLFGLVMPRPPDAAGREDLLHRTQVGTALCLPVYFVVAGLNVDLSGLRWGGALDLALIVVTAVVGKMAGTFLGARSQGMPGHDAAVLAALMNTRGLTELIVLGVGLQIGLLDDRLYSLLVVMAVVTTAMSGPLLSWLTARGRRGAGVADPHRAGAGPGGSDPAERCRADRAG